MDTQLITSGGIQTVAAIQYIYLDFDGEKTKYNGELMVIDDVVMNHSELNDQEIQTITDELNAKYRKSGVVFVTEKPFGIDFSTVYIGSSDSFKNFGAFAGLAETIDIGNRIKNDNAFVILRGFESQEKIINTIAHEVDHIVFGNDHGGNGLERYAYTIYNATYTGIVNSTLLLSYDSKYSDNQRVDGTWYEDGKPHPSYAYARNVTVANSGYLSLAESKKCGYNITIQSGGTVHNGIRHGVITNLTIENGGQYQCWVTTTMSSNEVTPSAAWLINVTWQPGGYMDQNYRYFDYFFAPVYQGGNIAASVQYMKGINIWGNVSSLSPESGGFACVFGTRAKDCILAKGGWLNINNGAEIKNTVIHDGKLFVNSGGIALNTKLGSGGILEVASGAIVEDINIGSGGLLQYKNQYNYSFTSLKNYGHITKIEDGFFHGETKDLDFEGTIKIASGGMATNCKVQKYGCIDLLSGASGNTLSATDGGRIEVGSGAVADRVNIGWNEDTGGYGILAVSSGGIARNVEVSGLKACAYISSGAVATHCNILSGASLRVCGGSLKDITIAYGAALVTVGGGASVLTGNIILRGTWGFQYDSIVQGDEPTRIMLDLRERTPDDSKMIHSDRAIPDWLSFSITASAEQRGEYRLLWNPWADPHNDFMIHIGDEVGTFTYSAGLYNILQFGNAEYRLKRPGGDFSLIISDISPVLLYQGERLVSATDVLNNQTLKFGGNNLLTVASGGAVQNIALEELTRLHASGGMISGLKIGSGAEAKINNNTVLRGGIQIAGRLDLFDGSDVSEADVSFLLAPSTARDKALINDAAFLNAAKSIRVTFDSSAKDGCYVLAEKADALYTTTAFQIGSRDLTLWSVTYGFALFQNQNAELVCAKFDNIVSWETFNTFVSTVKIWTWENACSITVKLPDFECGTDALGRTVNHRKWLRMSFTEASATYKGTLSTEGTGGNISHEFIFKGKLAVTAGIITVAANFASNPEDGLSVYLASGSDELMTYTGWDFAGSFGVKLQQIDHRYKLFGHTYTVEGRVAIDTKNKTLSVTGATYQTDRSKLTVTCDLSGVYDTLFADKELSWDALQALSFNGDHMSLTFGALKVTHLNLSWSRGREEGENSIYHGEADMAYGSVTIPADLLERFGDVFSIKVPDKPTLSLVDIKLRGTVASNGDFGGSAAFSVLAYTVGTETRSLIGTTGQFVVGRDVESDTVVAAGEITLAGIITANGAVRAAGQNLLISVKGMIEVPSLLRWFTDTKLYEGGAIYEYKNNNHWLTVWGRKQNDSSDFWYGTKYNISIGAGTKISSNVAIQNGISTIYDELAVQQKAIAEFANGGITDLRLGISYQSDSQNICIVVSNDSGEKYLYEYNPSTASLSMEQSQLNSETKLTIKQFDETGFEILIKDSSAKKWNVTVYNTDAKMYNVDFYAFSMQTAIDVAQLVFVGNEKDNSVFVSSVVMTSEINATIYLCCDSDLDGYDGLVLSAVNAQGEIRLTKQMLALAGERKNFYLMIESDSTVPVFSNYVTITDAVTLPQDGEIVSFTLARENAAYLSVKSLSAGVTETVKAIAAIVAKSSIDILVLGNDGAGKLQIGGNIAASVSDSTIASLYVGNLDGNGKVGGDVVTAVTDSRIGDLYAATSTSVAGAVKLTISGTSVITNEIQGGTVSGNTANNSCGSSLITLAGGTLGGVNERFFVHTGNRVTGNGSVAVDNHLTGSATLELLGGTVAGGSYLFVGGFAFGGKKLKGSQLLTTTVDNGTVLTVNGTKFDGRVSVYGGGRAATTIGKSVVENGSRITISTLTTTARSIVNFFGGAHNDGVAAIVNGGSLIQVSGSSTIGASSKVNLYGGGNGGSQSIHAIVNGGSEIRIGEVGAKTNITLNNVYGGGSGDSKVNGGSRIVIAGNGKVNVTGVLCGDGVTDGTVQGEKVLEFSNFNSSSTLSVAALKNFDSVIVDSFSLVEIGSRSLDLSTVGNFTFQLDDLPVAEEDVLLTFGSGVKAWQSDVNFSVNLEGTLVGDWRSTLLQADDSLDDLAGASVDWTLYGIESDTMLNCKIGENVVYNGVTLALELVDLDANGLADALQLVMLDNASLVEFNDFSNKYSNSTLLA